MGQQKLKAHTNEGRQASVVYQISEVSRPLTAVSQTCDRGNWVVYIPQGGFIQNCKSGARTHFEQRGDIYELDLWVKNEDLKDGSQTSSFTRPGLCAVGLEKRVRRRFTALHPHLKESQHMLVIFL